MHRRGGLTCPPETRRARTNEIVQHPIHGNQNQVAHSSWNSAERYFKEGILNRRLSQQVNRRDAVQNFNLIAKFIHHKMQYLPLQVVFINSMAQAVEFLQ